MPDLRQMTHAAMRALVQRCGSVDGVAETLAARWGRSVSKATISRKMNGEFDFTIADVIALEDVMGDYPVTRMMARRMTDPVTPGQSDLATLSGAVAKETGEAVAAVLHAYRSAQAEDRAEAVVEIDEAIAALRRARDTIEAQAEVSS